MKFTYDRDIGPAPLSGKKVAVIGFGSQGAAQAENLRDSGVDIAVGLRRESPSRESAGRAGLEVLEVGEASRWADVVALLIPDEAQKELYEKTVAPLLNEGDTLLFSHGFAVHFGLIEPPAGIDVVMVAPKGPGSSVRSEYRQGRGVVMLTAVHRDTSGKAGKTAMEYAAAIGGGRAGIFESTFREECETDLFGEQAVICGGLSHLVTAGFETLVEAGYSPEMAYLECLHEVKLTADLMHRRGITGMRKAISGTAAFGDLTRGPRVIGPGVKEEMGRILDEIRSGRFAREWTDDHHAGRRRFRGLMEEGARHPIDEVGSRLRPLIPSLDREREKPDAEEGRGKS